jgi:hypothetical protein
MTTKMTVSEIKSAIAAKLSQDASDYWHNTTEQNEFVVIAQRDGIDAAVAAVEEMAAE